MLTPLTVTARRRSRVGQRAKRAYQPHVSLVSTFQEFMSPFDTISRFPGQSVLEARVSGCGTAGVRCAAGL